MIPLMWVLRLAPIAVLLCVLCAFGWERHEANHWRKAYNDAMVSAHSAAVAQAQAHMLSQEVANVSHVAYYSDAAHDAGRYAAVHVVGGVCHSDPGGGLSATDSAAAQHDKSGIAPGMVAVTQSDFDLLTADAARLAEVQADAQALIDAGIAVTAP